MNATHARRCPKCDGPLRLRTLEAELGFQPKVLRCSCPFPSCREQIEFNDLPSVEILEVLADEIGWAPSRIQT